MEIVNPPTPVGFLVRLPAGGGVGVAAGAPSSLTALGARFELEPLFTVRAAEPAGAGLAAAAAPSWTWHVARPVSAADAPTAWDVAHALQTQAGLAIAGAPVLIEPDLEQEWPYENPAFRGDDGTLAAAACVFNDQRRDLPHVPGTFAWHLEDDRTQLRRARGSLTAPTPGIRIAHLDTGYDETHHALPAHLRLDLQRNFVGDQPADDARDPGARGLLKNPGHGTGTLSILAGKRFRFTSGAAYVFEDELGGAPGAEVVPVRVGKSVVQLRTSNIAKGINYAVELCRDEGTRVHVISMSMGGVASAAWADAVNMAYEAGIVFVAAAGNNFSAGIFGFPTHAIVYPARFRRAIAACGVMANLRPYYSLPFGTMQGNWGPQSKMATAMSAFTPNISWAELGCAGIVDMEGSGTSSATPQIAAAAALYLQRHGSSLFDPSRYPERWMRVEAVRQALFKGADKNADGGSSEKLGNGVLQAAASLAIDPPAAATLHLTPPDKASFPLLRVLTGIGAAPSPALDAMLELEATQLAHRWSRTDRPNPIEMAVTDPDLPADAVPVDQVRRFLEAVLAHPDASAALKARAAEARGALAHEAPLPGRRRAVKPRKTPITKAQIAKALPAAVPNPRPFVPGRPAFRALRGYGFDPSLATSLETAPISEVTFKVPWEKLDRGPIGEYLEVIDADPASGCFYEPVDLDQPAVLAQSGLMPSEGTPQFHQQMVYAAASLTIRNFERALGRRSLWRPRRAPGTHPKNDSVFVQRLRVYPHALREANAYYSPQRVALLFGYFKAIENDPGSHVPGGMVFTCLSHDIIAHETTHALLDGMHRYFLKRTNPDVRAFHEAFADIVALMQHFTFPEILRHQIARTRGDLQNQEHLLGQLAGQFGRSTGLRGALRYAIGKHDPVTNTWRPHQPDPAEYDATTQAHARGGILVAAVFEAFLGIYNRRSADLLRLATGGSGVLRPGALHPDLVARLADEASKSAQHVLTMCIRALDYCPPVDITFGEFLRAVITADTDAVPDDDLHYRIAFVEAFRRRGLYPRDLRTLSPDSLLWRTPESDEVRPSKTLQGALQRLQPYASEFLFAQSDGITEPRERVFFLQRELRRELHDWLETHFATHPDGHADAAFLGLDPAHGFEVHSARFALRPSPDGDIDAQVLIGVTQEISIPIDPALPGIGSMAFEGGTTIVGDLRRLKIRYCVRKNVGSAARQSRQQAFRAASLASARATYFGPDEEGLEPFAALHRGEEL
jgi:subtilisin family serine protease